MVDNSVDDEDKITQDKKLNIITDENIDQWINKD